MKRVYITSDWAVSILLMTSHEYTLKAEASKNIMHTYHSLFCCIEIIISIQ